MKNVFILFAIASVLSANAQAPIASVNETRPIAVTSPVFKTDHRYLITDTEPANTPGLRKKKMGATMTIIGSVLLVTGVALVASADELYYSSNTTNGNTVEEGDPKGAIGVLLIAGGLGLTIPGIIIGTKGKKQYDRYKRSQQKTVSLNLRTNTAGLVYRF